MTEKEYENYKKVSEGKVSVEEIRQIALTYISKYSDLKEDYFVTKSKLEKLKIITTSIKEMIKVVEE